MSRSPRGGRGSGWRGSFSLEAGRHLLRLLRPLSSGAGGMEAQALQRARGEVNHRRRPGREANVHRLCPHSRTSGPPSRPSVYLFTFPGSSNTSAFSELRSAGGRPGAPWPPEPCACTVPGWTPPVGGGVRSEQPQSKTGRSFGKVRRDLVTPTRGSLAWCAWRRQRGSTECPHSARFPLAEGLLA